MKKVLFELIYLLLDEKRLFLNPGFSGKDITAHFFPGESVGESLILEEFGCSMNDLISYYRLQHARNLLVEGFGFEVVWRYSGFKSKRLMIKALSRVVVYKKNIKFDSIMPEN